MTPPRILIAGIGNIFLGDDGFGTEVARRLAGRALPPEVTLKDFGISGIDLTYALLDPYDLVIMVDACARGGEPGTLYLIEPRTEDGARTTPFEAHSMNPVNVLRTVRQMGGARGKILLIGCEPADLGAEEGKLGLSAPVEAAIGEAIGMIEKLVAEKLGVSQSH
jgi:hydrogenase maturation protease